MLSSVIPEDPIIRDPNELLIPDPMPNPIPDPDKPEPRGPPAAKGAPAYHAVIPEDPRHAHPTEYPPMPPRDPNEPLPIDEPVEPGIPLEDPPSNPDDPPGNEPMIDPPPPQAASYKPVETDPSVGHSTSLANFL